MENGAPIISFNAIDDPYDDEELLVVNSPTKKRDTSDKGCMTDNESGYFMPSKVEISFKDSSTPSHKLKLRSGTTSAGSGGSGVGCPTTTNALVIGEMPINLSDICQSPNKGKHGSGSGADGSGTGAGGGGKNSSFSSFNFIDSPTSTSDFSYKNSILPYLILPFASGIRKLKLENNDSYCNFYNNHKRVSNFDNQNNDSSGPGTENTAMTSVAATNDASNDLSSKKNKEIQMKSLVVKDGAANTNSAAAAAASTVADNDDDESDNGGREQWSRKTEFLLAIIGFSVDLGNIWRFPKVVFENGGGRFLIPYFIQLALCGLPFFYMELALGQFHQTGLFTLWERICPLFKGLAFTAIIIDLFMAMFYNTIIAWSVYYLYLSMSFELPWSECNQPWNTMCCLTIRELANKNLSLNDTDFQLSKSNSFVYRVYQSVSNVIDKRVVLFDKGNASYGIGRVFTAINYFYEQTNPNVSSSIDTSGYLNSTIVPSFNVSSGVSSSLVDHKINQFNKWIRSFFLIKQGRVVDLPEIYVDSSNVSKYLHDPMLIRTKIEELVNSMYKNETLDLFVNCDKDHFNNPTHEFYTRYLTQMNRSTGLENLGGVKWQMIICLFIVFVTVYFALWKGIKSAGKAVWITATAPYIVMFILLIRGLTLPGAMSGIEFYLKVEKWASLLEWKIWVNAATQIFFSLGPGFGTIIALSSYNKKHNNCYHDALLTSFINCLTSILSGFVVFSTLGYMTQRQGKQIKDITDNGPELIFITYPQAISVMPFAPLWAIIFFFMLFTLGIDSTFGGLEAVITAVCDLWPKTFGQNRSWFVLALISLCFIGAIPTVTYGGPYIVHLFDSYTVTPSILIVVFFQTIGVMYIYGCERFCQDIEFMIKSRPNRFWIICWKYISPSLIVVMTVMVCKDMLAYPLNYGKYDYTGVGQTIACLIVGVPISFIPMYVVYRLYNTEGSSLKEKFLKSIKGKEINQKHGVNIVKENGDSCSVTNSNSNNNNINTNCIIVKVETSPKKPVSL